MATYNWIGSDTTLDGDWNTGSLWSGGEVPPDGSDVVIDVINPGTAYTVTIGAGESETVDSLTLNQGGDGTNSDPYVGAYFEMDGTLTFAGPDDGLIAGSRQTQLTTNGGTFVNAGTVAPLFLCNGNVLFTGTNGFYVENALVSLGTVTIDTSSISEIIGNTLTDGIYSTSGPGDIINLGGSGQGLTVDIQAMEGPQAPDNLGGWSELTLDGPGASINEWNGTAYVPVDTSLTHIMGGGTLDVETGATFTAASTLTIDHTGASDGAGMLNLQDGTVVAAAIDLENGILQGSGTVSDPLINNGTVMAVNGTLDLTGSVTGTGIIEFDTDIEAQLAGTVAATLMVNSVSAGQTIMMNGDDTLVLNTPTAFAGTIEASIGAEIVLQGMTATTAVVTGGNLVISDGSAVVDTLALSGSVVADGFLATGSIITVTTAFPAPTISGAVANQAVSGTATVDPFSSVTIADPNAAATDTVTVALSAAANGTLSNLGTGSYNSTTGVYTATGSTSALTTDLDGLVFTPTAAAAGQTVTTGFNISVIDTLGASATDSTTSVTATFSLTPTPTPTPAPTPTPTPAPTPTPTVIPGFSAVDMSTDQAITTGPTPYSGPVSGLTDEYITTTSDNLNISVSTPGWFIHTGSGEDAVQVSSGTNVLDGSTGSNFLVGGTGDDTFFVDDRSPAASVWSTISNFHSGDAATVWGVTPGDFTLTWVDGQGAAGYTGLTLHVTASGEPTASLTLAGYTSAALTNGALTISYGTTAAENGVPGSTYMYVHAN